MAKKENAIDLNNTEKEFMNRLQKLCHTRQSWEEETDDGIRDRGMGGKR